MTLEFQKDIPIQTLSYYYKPYKKREPEAQSYNFTDTRFLKNEKGFYLAERTNIPAFKQEPHMPPANNVRPWMQLQGVSINITGISETSISFSIKDPSNPTQYWGAVAGEKVKRVEFMNKPDKDIKKAALEITASASTDEEKLRKLYEFCQTQIRNVNFDPTATDDDKLKAFRQKTLSEVLKVKFTDGNWLNLLFGAMAKSLGFDTRLAYSGNRSKMLFDPRMTNEAFVHESAVAIQFGNDWKFFDPGTAFLPYGMLDWHDEDVWTLVVSERQNAWVKTPMTGTDKSVAKRSGKFKLLEDGTLEGDVRIEYMGQSALSARLDTYEDSSGKREEDFKEEIKQRISTAEVSGITIENVTDISKPLVYQYKIRVPNYAQKTGKRIFLQPGVFEYGRSPLFSSETRKYAIYFEYPWSENDEIEIELPKNVEADSIDAPGEVNETKGLGSLHITIALAKETNVLKFTRQFYFGGNGKIIFPAEAYKPLKFLFDSFHKADTHTISLKQKQ
jgi:hypothetical protein